MSTIDANSAVTEAKKETARPGVLKAIGGVAAYTAYSAAVLAGMYAAGAYGENRLRHHLGGQEAQMINIFGLGSGIPGHPVNPQEIEVVDDTRLRDATQSLE